MGTLPYMSPELCDPLQTPSGMESDLWSFGITLVCLSTGSLPYLPVHVAHLAELHMNQPLTLPLQLNRDMVQVIRGLLNVNAIERMTLSTMREHAWTTRKQTIPLPSINDNLTNPVLPRNPNKIGATNEHQRSKSQPGVLLHSEEPHHTRSRSSQDAEETRKELLVRRKKLLARHLETKQ